MCSAPWPHPLHGPTKCGQCMECRLAYSREWAIRMTHEAQMHPASCFLTLTYNDANLPRYGQLVKSDLQKFFKRLRKSVGPFRYVACGEYGEIGRRPHFHVAIFGLDFSFDRIESSEGIRGDKLYVSPTLHAVWGKGDLLQQTIGSLTFESAAYIARYITTRISGIGASPRPLACSPDGELIMPEPEFLLCSRKPAIGHSWFLKYGNVDVIPHGRVITAQGTPAPVPRAYKNIIASTNPWFKNLNNPLNRVKASLMAKTNENMASVPVDKLILENSPQRRAARTIYAKARTGAFKREVK